jgi:hypothetical protein
MGGLKKAFGWPVGTHKTRLTLVRSIIRGLVLAPHKVALLRAHCGNSTPKHAANTSIQAFFAAIQQAAQHAAPVHTGRSSTCTPVDGV